MNIPKVNIFKAVESCLVRLLHSPYANMTVPTRNPGTGSAPPDEMINLLRSIDGRLANLERCVRKSPHGSGDKHIATGPYSH